MTGMILVYSCDFGHHLEIIVRRENYEDNPWRGIRQHMEHTFEEAIRSEEEKGFKIATGAVIIFQAKSVWGSGKLWDACVNVWIQALETSHKGHQLS